MYYWCIHKWVYIYLYHLLENIVFERWYRSNMLVRVYCRGLTVWLHISNMLGLPEFIVEDLTNWLHISNMLGLPELIVEDLTNWLHISNMLGLPEFIVEDLTNWLHRSNLLSDVEACNDYFPISRGAGYY